MLILLSIDFDIAQPKIKWIHNILYFLQKPHPLASSKVQQFLKTKDGQVATALVREFLEFFELDYTCAVFDPESNAVCCTCMCVDMS